MNDYVKVVDNYSDDLIYDLIISQISELNDQIATFGKKGFLYSIFEKRMICTYLDAISEEVLVLKNRL